MYVPDKACAFLLPVVSSASPRFYIRPFLPFSFHPVHISDVKTHVGHDRSHATMQSMNDDVRVHWPWWLFLSIGLSLHSSSLFLSSSTLFLRPFLSRNFTHLFLCSLLLSFQILSQSYVPLVCLYLLLSYSSCLFLSFSPSFYSHSFVHSRSLSSWPPHFHPVRITHDAYADANTRRKRLHPLLSRQPCLKGVPNEGPCARVCTPFGCKRDLTDKSQSERLKSGIFLMKSAVRKYVNLNQSKFTFHSLRQ